MVMRGMAQPDHSRSVVLRRLTRDERRAMQERFQKQGMNRNAARALVRESRAEA